MAYESKQMRQDSATIRKAHKESKTEFMLNGIEMTVKLVVRSYKKVTGGQRVDNVDNPEVVHDVTDRWLVAKPVDGMLPVFCIEETPGHNGIFGKSKR